MADYAPSGVYALRLVITNFRDVMDMYKSPDIE